MEYLKEDRNTIENVIKFMDSVSKALEGLKDKFSVLILEAESKNEKPESVLKNWVHQAHNIVKEKFEEVYEVKYDDTIFKKSLKNWLQNFKDNQEFLLNSKFLFKNLQHIKNTVKSKITANDSLSYMNLTDVLINKTKIYK
jgi:hypothetical protein